MSQLEEDHRGEEVDIIEDEETEETWLFEDLQLSLLRKTAFTPSGCGDTSYR